MQCLDIAKKNDKILIREIQKIFQYFDKYKKINQTKLFYYYDRNK